MGNNIGFQADIHTVKLAYIQSNPQHINFIHNLNSNYLRSCIPLANKTIFLFQCSIDQFISYHTTENVHLLRNQYEKLLSASLLVIRTNRATINVIEGRKQLYNALMDILMKKFELEHTEKIENSVQAMKVLQTNCLEFYRFRNQFNITQLHNFDLKLSVAEKVGLEKLPEEFVLVQLRNGITAYRIQNGKKIERIQGSIIGERTIASILNYKYLTKTTKQCLELAFSDGNIKQTDLMVEDIYGKTSHNLGLPGDIVASSMGKLAKMSPKQLQSLNQGDIIRSLVTTFAINTANLTALYLTKTNLNDAVVLADCFHDDRFYALVQAISGSYAPGKGIYFAEHSPFLGCLGTAFNNCAL